MQFKINNLEYAWVGNDIKHIDSANKEDSYYLDEGLTIPLVYCNGTVVKSYWRKESNIDESIIRNFFGSSESVEHYNKKIQLSKSLVLNNVSIDDEIQDYVILGSSSIVEYRAKEINKIIDLVYLDNNGDVLVGIEIFCTNKKTSKDIEKFNKLKFPVYEYDINKGVCYPISAPNTNTEEQRRIYSEINEIERNLSGVRIRIERGREYVCEQQERIKLENKKYWEETNRIEEIREDIMRARYGNSFGLSRPIEEFTRERRYLENQIREFKQREVQETISVQKQIEQFTRNESKEIKTITKEINHLKEIIKYLEK
tara:strand:+ start:93 stop:1034 length:942 start_codon:yes stop_codon:yes gene_type:complete